MGIILKILFVKLFWRRLRRRRVALVDGGRPMLQVFKDLNRCRPNLSCILGLGCWGGERLRPMSRMAGGTVISSSTSLPRQATTESPTPLTKTKKRKEKKLVT